MKTNASLSHSARTTFAMLLFLCGTSILCSIPFLATRAQLPSNIIPFSGTFDPAHAYGAGCTSLPNPFVVPAGQARIVVNVDATVPTDDIAVTLLSPTNTPLHTEDNGVGNEAFDYEPGGGVTPGTYSIVVCSSANPLAPMQSPYTYNGVFTYNDVAVSSSCQANFTTTLPAAPADNGPKVGYENFEAPGVLTPITQSSSGGLTYEYMGRGAGEPSDGVNWVTGVVNFQSDLETLFITFDDSCNLSHSKDTWANRRAPTSQFVDSDPIGFTDHSSSTANRVFASELTLLSPDTVKISYSDDDGQTWVANQSGGIASAVDHETIGGGHYHAPLVGVAYPNAIYYCSQDLETALCSRSDTGGLTYGPSIPMYVATQCGGLHGHVKVAPDGTVYLPNRDCSGTQSVVVSEDNGITWALRPVNTCTFAAAPSTVGTGDDPALSIDASGRVYFAFSNSGTSAGVAVSEDKGVHWKNMYDVGAGLHNVAFPAAIAGDDKRAAVAFYGSKTPQGPTTGDSNTGNFTGVWHLYVAHTYDGGASWTTSDVTPNAPMQRSGLLRGGGADITRNLLDFFDIQMDAQGRAIVGYVNGCSGGNCAQAPINPDGTTSVKGNTYSATATLARQSSGRRLVANFDPPNSPTAPGMPFVTQRRIGPVVHLGWNEADTGNNPAITNYQILRSSVSGAETLLTTVPGTQTKYDDYSAADPTKTYYYKVVAVVNGVGSSCPNNEVAAPFVGDNCSGVIIHQNDPSHPEATGGGATNPPVGPTPTPAPTPGPATPQLLIDYIAVGEPAGGNDLMFKLKVVNLNTLPPNSRWRIAWDWWTPATQLYYIGMATDAQSHVTFEYGTLADAGVPAVLVLGETPIANCTAPTNSCTLPSASAPSQYNADGTITMFVPKSAVGNPQPGDILAAIGGKTITGDTPTTNTFERSTTFVDHTFIKGESDNAFPPANYTMVGNGVCAVQPTLAQSRKTHGTAGTFNVTLPLVGAFGIEDRSGPVPSGVGKYLVVVTLPVGLTGVSSVGVTPGQGGTASLSSYTVNTNTHQVTVSLSNVSSPQLLTVDLFGVSVAGKTGDVIVPMGVLIGDVNASHRTDNGDAIIVRNLSGIVPTDTASARADVNCSGRIDNGDAVVIRNNSGQALP